uniref:Structural maintenance of chromosomes protein 5 n=1 Tax=Phlebotomus papatasi TaxID=29031 RepID=A0A1B0GQF2_PHLPP
MAEGNWRGKIKSITVNNFITYDSVKVSPGPYLNVILGPNGTGKSTLVAAIVIGMGGNCQTLSRGKTLVDYIKNGKTKAAISIDIYKDNEKNVVEFFRVFDNTGSGTFKVDKKKVSQKAYLDEVKKYNIQIDNLCQFLPQDRVQDFAKMNPEEIFINTVKSVCDSEAQEIFEQLKEMEKDSGNSGAELAKWKADLKEAEAQNLQLKVRIENMSHRTQLQEKLQVAKIKKGHLELEELLAKTQDYNKDLEDAKKCLKENEKKLQPIKQESQDFINQIKKLETDGTTQKNNLQKISSKLANLDGDTEKEMDAIRQIKAEFQNVKRQAQTQESDIAEETNVLTALLKDLQISISQTGTLNAKKASLDQKIAELQKENEALLQERNQVAHTLQTEVRVEINSIKRKLEKMQSAEQQHLAAMESRFPDMYKAVMWLKDNRDMFQGTIYDPILLELKLKNLADGKFLENIISQRDLLAFVCEDVNDMKLLVKKLTHEMKLSVNIVQSDPAEKIKFTPSIPINQLRRYGFTKYILDMVEGPVPILNYICQIYNVHNIPVGTNRSSDMIDEIIAAGQLQLFFTPDHRYSVAKSKYSSASSTTCNEIASHNMMRQVLDERQVEEERKTLQHLIRRSDAMNNQINECEAKLSYNEQKAKNVKVELREITVKTQHMTTVQQRVKAQQKKIKDIRENVIDIKAEEIKCKESVKASLVKLLQLQKDKIDQVAEYMKFDKDLLFNREYLKRFNSGNSDLKKKLCEAEQTVEVSQKLVERIKTTIDGHKRKISDKKGEIKSLVEAVFPADTKYQDIVHFRTLPGRIEELLEEIGSLQAQVDCMEGHNERVIEEFEARQKKIDELNQKIANDSARQRSLLGKITELHESWYPEIIKVVDQINTKFSRFMQSMMYAGEVMLTMKSPYAYSTYGISIKVVYRNNEALQQLNSFLQSGGERTVAIATYTLALQQLTQVPFRCVDEINQGMDPKNERKIFEMLVDETSKSGMSQYFFITPKLLPNLKCNDYMVFHCIFNGPHVASPVMFLGNENYMLCT